MTVVCGLLIHSNMFSNMHIKQPSMCPPSHLAIVTSTMDDKVIVPCVGGFFLLLLFFLIFDNYPKIQLLENVIKVTFHIS